MEAEEIDPFKQLVAARTPLIKQHHVPLEWIQGLNPTDLCNLLAGIRAAEGLGVDWRSWIGEHTAREVLADVIPNMKTGGGTTVAQA